MQVPSWLFKYGQHSSHFLECVDHNIRVDEVPQPGGMEAVLGLENALQARRGGRLVPSLGEGGQIRSRKVWESDGGHRERLRTRCIYIKRPNVDIPIISR